MLDHDRLALITSFVSVAERYSFARVADILTIFPSTVSRHVARLEAALDARLLSRTTRRVVLTEAGQLYFQECCAVLDRLFQAGSLVTGFSREAKRPLRASLPVARGAPDLSAVRVSNGVPGG
jgi:DNA-binding transcriptional LysR family regulator